MVKLGIIVFGNHSGLGNQTRRLTEMLKPERILFIKSDGFSKNKQIRKDWYSGYNGYIVDGFPSGKEINIFLKDLTHVLVCENPLNFYLFSRAKELGIKTYCQSNYEFCDNLSRSDLPLPDYFLMPSHWHLKTMADKFGEERVKYLPPPIDPNEFKEAREVNFQRKKEHLKLLHIVGTLAVNDRNGTLDLLAALKYTDMPFTLSIHSQHPLPANYNVGDSRVVFSVNDVEDAQRLYSDYDAVILPRRYGGLSLVMNEALISGLPVFMPDISPNSSILPSDWLYPAEKIGEFQTRSMIEFYKSDPEKIARKIEWLKDADLERLKLDAFQIGYDNFSHTALENKYSSLFSL